MKVEEALRKVKISIPKPDLPEGNHKVLLGREVSDQIDNDLEEVSAMFPLRLVDRVCIEKPLDTSRARVILDEVITQKQSKNLEKQILKMKKEGKEWSEIEDWITRQIGYDKEVIEKGREIYVGGK